FYGQENKLGMRPTAYADMLAKIGARVIINPSAYYTSQKGAVEIMYGSLVSVKIGEPESSDGSLVFGVYHRWNEAIVGTFGYDWNGLRAMVSYDYTTSQLGQYI